MKCPKCNSDNPDTQQFCGKCGIKLVSAKDIAALSTKSIETPGMKLSTGSVFAGRYQIVEELGQGGMGKVYRVIDKQLNEEVALKLIRPEIALDKKAVKRFRNELKLCRKIIHRNVGRMYELMEDEGSLFITMEYVSGQDLKGLIQQSGRLAVGTTISIAKQVCEGLAEAHRLGVIHRDLKSPNILIDKKGEARIVDFGIARSLTGKSITRVGAMIGTPEYMSPEQTEAKELDHRCDIYSLGIILYEMMTGQLPFEGDTPLSVAMKHKGEIPIDPKELNPQIPGDLSRLILKCLEKDKENRYQEAEELCLELENIERRIPTTERVAPRKKTTTSKEITVTFNLRRFCILASVAAALVIAAAVIWPFLPKKYSIQSPPDTPSIAVLPFEDFSSAKDQGYFCEGLRESIIHALKQARNLRVPATTFMFQGKQRDYRQIGQTLKVKTVLDGSVQKVEDKVRIIAKLIDITDESIIWTDQFDPEQQDIFSILDTISMTIADKLKVNILEGEKTGTVKRYTQDPEAWDLYSWGRYFWNKRTEDGIKTAINYFELAIEQDPSYALAHVGVSDCYNLLGSYAYMEPNEAFPKAMNAALKALNLDDTLAEAHTSLGLVLIHNEWDWERAESEFKRAIELNPNYATAHHWYSIFLAMVGKFDESHNRIKRAHALDPGSTIINTQVGSSYLRMQQFDQAIDALRRVLLIDEGFWFARLEFSEAYAAKGMYEESFAELKKAKDLYKGWHPQIESYIGITYARMGRTEEAQNVLNSLLERSKQRYVPPIFIAGLYLNLGEIDQCFDWGKRALEVRDSGLTWLGVISASFPDSFRSDPRFIELMEKIGLNKYWIKN
jgi:serine/threonine protein kinase/Tfp pilus assembly protein PilF